MKEKIKALLKALGMSAEAIENYLEGDDAKLKDLDPKKDAKAIQEHLKEVLSNDAAFVDTFKSQARAAVLSSKEKKFKELFDLTDEEVAALPEKNRYDAMIKLGADKVEERLEAAKKKGKVSDEVKGQIEELNAQIKTLKGTVKEYEEVKLPGAQKEADGKVAAMEMRFGLLGKLHTKAEDMLIKPEFTIDKLMSDLQGQYAIVNSGGKLELKQKDNPEMEVFVDNEKLTVDKAVEQFLTENELLKASNGADPKGKGGRGDGGAGGGGGNGGDDSNLPPGMKKAEAHAKELTGSKED